MTRPRRAQIYDVLEEGDTHPVAKPAVKALLLTVIATTVIAAALETLDSLSDRAHVLFAVIELVAVTVLTVEYALRLSVRGARAPE